MEELTAKLAISVEAVLSISDAELAEAVEAYSHVGRDGRLGTMAAEEDEDLFACRASLLRLHHLQLLTQASADAPQLYLSLHKLLQVCCLTSVTLDCATRRTGVLQKTCHFHLSSSGKFSQVFASLHWQQ